MELVLNEVDRIKYLRCGASIAIGMKAVKCGLESNTIAILKDIELLDGKVDFAPGFGSQMPVCDNHLAQLKIGFRKLFTETPKNVISPPSSAKCQTSPRPPLEI